MSSKVWCAYKIIRTFPPQYVPRLLITGVPPEVEITEWLLREAGYSFERLIPWVSHGVVDFEEFPDDLLERVRGGGSDIECISYEELQALLRGCVRYN